jgi:hypothetical protein
MLRFCQNEEAASHVLGVFVRGVEEILKHANISPLDPDDDDSTAETNKSKQMKENQELKKQAAPSMKEVTKQAD